MGYFSRDDLRELEENMMKRKYNRSIDRNIVFIFSIFVLFMIYTAILGIFSSTQN